jgi:hypothetical protein
VESGIFIRHRADGTLHRKMPPTLDVPCDRQTVRFLLAARWHIVATRAAMRAADLGNDQ